MRALLAFALLAALSACGARVSRGDAEAAEPAAFTGRFNAASDTARSLTGGVSITRDGLAFDTGAMLATRIVGEHHGWDQIARDGDTFAAAAVGPSDLSVELRRVTSTQSLRRAPELCATAPGYVAIVHKPQRMEVTLLVFAGDEQPGPQAARSTLCAAFAYTLPSGARTREGVVLR